jgi:hypothetical protein
MRNDEQFDVVKRAIAFYFKDAPELTNETYCVQAYLKLPPDLVKQAERVKKIDIRVPTVAKQQTLFSFSIVNRQEDYWLVRSDDMPKAANFDFWKTQTPFNESIAEGAFFFEKRHSGRLLVDVLDVYIRLFSMESHEMLAQLHVDTDRDPLANIMAGINTRLTLAWNRWREHAGIAEYPQLDKFSEHVRKILDAITDPLVMGENGNEEQVILRTLKRVVVEIEHIEKMMFDGEFAVQADAFEVKCIVEKLQQAPGVAAERKTPPPKIIEPVTAMKPTPMDTDATLMLTRTQKVSLVEMRSVWEKIADTHPIGDETLIVRK